MAACAKETYRSAMRIRNDSAVDHRDLRRGSAFQKDVIRGAVVPGRSGGEHLEHSRGNARASAIVADLERSDSEVTLDIKDDGGPFDPRLVATPQTPQTVETASVGGRGIHLIRQFSSRMEYFRTGGRNLRHRIARKVATHLDRRAAGHGLRKECPFPSNSILF
jgi:hypothetical protein